MLSRRLTPGQRLAAMPLFILGGLFSLAAGHMIADRTIPASAVVVRQAPSAQHGGSRVLAPTASPTPTATAPTTAQVTAPKTAPAAALSSDTDKDAAPTKNPPMKGGHAKGKDKGHGKGHGKRHHDD